MFYVGSSSETHAQNLFFSYNMAFGGGGFAISFPLAKALAQMQDQCNLRYPFHKNLLPSSPLSPRPPLLLTVNLPFQIELHKILQQNLAQ
jgi:hypothetical protein